MRVQLIGETRPPIAAKPGQIEHYDYEYRRNGTANLFVLIDVNCPCRREVSDPLHVVMLGLRRELADRHVFDHAPPQRAHGLVGHGGCSCLGEGYEPLISRQDASLRDPLSRAAGCRALTRERFSPLTRSGLSAGGQHLRGKSALSSQKNVVPRNNRLCSKEADLRDQRISAEKSGSFTGAAKMAEPNLAPAKA
jgi:hypothetical protein